MNTTTATGGRALPLYQSHKKIWALKIASIQHTEGKGWVIDPEESGYGRFSVSDEYVAKHKPQAGGYWVKYEDGYESWSPGPQFEAGNTLIA